MAVNCLTATGAEVLHYGFAANGVCQRMRMSDNLFRDEALEYFARSDGPGELVHSSAGWVNVAYAAFLALVVAGLLVSLIVQVNGEPLLLILLPALSGLVGAARG
jgi:hypothetical protein